MMKTHSKRNRDLKRAIVLMHLRDGMSVQQLSETFKIPAATLYSWSTQYRKYGEDAFIGCGYRRQEGMDMRRLREENERLRMKLAEKQ